MKSGKVGWFFALIVLCLAFYLATFFSVMTGTADAFFKGERASGYLQSYIVDLEYSTFLGGSSADCGRGIKVVSGNAYVGGYTDSLDFPTSENWTQPSFGGGSFDAFVSKFSSDGSLLYSSYFGGYGDDVAYAIDVLTLPSHFYVTGSTTSPDFPVKNPYQSSLAGGSDAFITEFTSDGYLLFSTYLGGYGDEAGRDIDLPSDGPATPYIVGHTTSTNFPIYNAYQTSSAGGTDVFITALDFSGWRLLRSTYFGGSGDDYGHGIDFYSSYAILSIVGYTSSLDFPTYSPYQASSAGGIDVFVTTFEKADLNNLESSTYLGGSSDDYGRSLDAKATRPLPTISITGYTQSSDFPTVSPYQASLSGGTDAFLCLLSTSGNLTRSTYLGGTGDDAAYSIDGMAVAGETSSADFPIRGAYQPALAGGLDAFFTRFIGSSIWVSSYLGGTGNDSAYGVYGDYAGSSLVYLAGETASADFPTRNSYQPNLSGGNDAFVVMARVNSTPSSPTPSPTVTPTPEDYKTPTPTPSPTPTPTPTPTPSPTPTPTAIPGQDVPFTENFEGAWSGGAPSLWTKEYISGTHDWIKASGGYDGNPPSAHGGSYNALFFIANYTRPVTRLISPRLRFWDLTNNPRLVFWQAMAKFRSDQDELSVYYRSAEADPWTLLAEYDASVLAWTRREILLPDPSDDYFICFEGTANFGYGVCLDDVLVTGESSDSSLVIDSGDYDGDGTSDIAIFRGSSGLWSVRGVTRVYYGSSSDLPIPGDYNGDGAAEIGIFRGSSGLWGIRDLTRVYFGSSSDIPTPGDYDGDGSCDVGIFRDSSGLWAVVGVTRTYFGTSGDLPVPGDYEGDGRKDIALFRSTSGMWAIQGLPRVYYGSSSDTVVPGDYDGDGTWEVGIFRGSSGMWAVRGVTRIYYGASSDTAVPADYNGDSKDDVGIFRGSSGLWGLRNISRAYFGTSGDLPVTR